jgi:DNA-binding XRE family transcriptional regulator
MKGAMHWAGQLKRYRRIHGLTQAALAEVLNVEQATISRWERGMHAPDLGIQRRLRALIFGRGLHSDNFIFNRVSHSPFAVKVASRSAQNLAASMAAAHLHHVDQSTLASANYRPLFTETLEKHWAKALELGFFDGDIASIQVRTPWKPLGGGEEKLCVSYWMPAQLSDGEIVLISEFSILQRDALQHVIPDESFVARSMDEIVV